MKFGSRLTRCFLNAKFARHFKVLYRVFGNFFSSTARAIVYHIFIEKSTGYSRKTAKGRKAISPLRPLSPRHAGDGWIPPYQPISGRYRGRTLSPSRDCPRDRHAHSAPAAASPRRRRAGQQPRPVFPSPPRSTPAQKRPGLGPGLDQAVMLPCANRAASASATYPCHQPNKGLGQVYPGQ
jgi:hypothetical protein